MWKNSTRGMQNNTKSNIHIIGVPEEVEKHRQRTLKKLTKNSPNLTNNINLQTQDAQ